MRRQNSAHIEVLCWSLDRIRVTCLGLNLTRRRKLCFGVRILNWVRGLGCAHVLGCRSGLGRFRMRRRGIGLLVALCGRRLADARRQIGQHRPGLVNDF